VKLKNSAYIKTVNMQVFGCDILLCVTEHPNEFIDKSGLRLYCSPDDPEENLEKGLSGFVFSKQKGDYYLVVPPHVNVDCAVHECVHVIDRIFRDRGQEADYENDEVYAYYVGWLAQQLFDWVGDVDRHEEKIKEPKETSL
jgi:hypothetical protein